MASCSKDTDLNSSKTLKNSLDLMMINNLSITKNNSETVNQKQLLTIYVCIDLVTTTPEVENLIKKCLEVYIQTKCKHYILSKVQLVTIKLPPHIIFDCIHEGLMTFTEMYSKLKLKDVGKAWFLYISSGNIRSIYSNVSVMLLNNSVNKKEAKYVINKEPINLKSEMSKDEKLAMLRTITTNLDQIMSNQNKNIIKYDNIEFKFVN